MSDSVQCPSCGHRLTPADHLRSFGGKFCPACGARLAAALTAENEIAKKTLSLAVIRDRLDELLSEPIRKNLGLKLAGATLAVLLIQAVLFGAYQAVRPGEPAAAAEFADPASAADFQAAIDAQNAGDYFESERLLQQILAREPDSTRALNSLGFLAKLEQRPEAAAQYFDQVVGLDPANVVANQNLGILAASRGDAAAARGYFDAVLAVEPENATVLELKSKLN